MLGRQTSLTKIEMWLAVQYWEKYYNNEDYIYESQELENEDKEIKKVTFSDQNDVQEIETENQFYKFSLKMSS